MFAGFINPQTARLATVSVRDGGLQLHNRANFDTGEFGSFELILQRYLRNQEAHGGLACFAVAAPVSDNHAKGGQLPWEIDGARLAAQFGFTDVSMVDEHIATARGIFELPPDKLFTINQGVDHAPGNIGLMTVDERLCEALMVLHGNNYSTFVTHGGHTSFGPTSQVEVELWQHLYAERKGIEVGDVVSRNGLKRIYRFFVESRGGDLPGWFRSADDVPAMIIEQALAGKDQTAVETVDVFVDCFAAEAANLALRGRTSGGLYLGGRIVSELMPALDQGRFIDDFIKGGEVEEYLAGVPIQVLMDRGTALLGAARIVLEMNGGS